MPVTVDPDRFTGLPLLTKRLAPGDYAVTVDGLRAGRIMRQPRAFGVEVWLWSVTGPALVQAGLSSSGEADSLHDARLAFREALDGWLAWRTAQGGKVYRFG